VSTWTFTSESVTEGHPDKMADQISDSILDAYLAGDPYSRVACETLVTTGIAVIAGEVRSDAVIDAEAVARSTIVEIGYDRPELGYDGNTVEVEREQSEFSANAMRYQASLRFLDGRIKGLLRAIKGNG